MGKRVYIHGTARPVVELGEPRLCARPLVKYCSPIVRARFFFSARATRESAIFLWYARHTSYGSKRREKHTRGNDVDARSIDSTITEKWMGDKGDEKNRRGWKNRLALAYEKPGTFLRLSRRIATEHFSRATRARR